MKLDDFKTYCKRFVAPKKVVDEYFSNAENLKDNYTSEDTNAAYEFYMNILANAPKEVRATLPEVVKRRWVRIIGIIGTIVNGGDF